MQKGSNEQQEALANNILLQHDLLDVLRQNIGTIHAVNENLDNKAFQALLLTTGAITAIVTIGDLATDLSGLLSSSFTRFHLGALLLAISYFIQATAVTFTVAPRGYPSVPGPPEGKDWAFENIVYKYLATREEKETTDGIKDSERFLKEDEYLDIMTIDYLGVLPQITRINKQKKWGNLIAITMLPCVTVSLLIMVTSPMP